MRTTILIASVALLIGAALCHVDAAADPPKTVAAAQAVDKPLGDLSLDDATLLDALLTVRQRGNVRLTVDWDALDAVGVTPKSKVTLAGRGVTVAQALDLTLGHVEGATGPLCWFVHGRNIHITSRAAAMRVRRPASSQPSRSRPARPTARPASQPVLPRLSLRFDEMPLAEVVTFFRRRTGLNLTVDWRALEAIGVSRDTPVTLTIDKPVPLTQALDLVVDLFNPAAPPTGRVFWDVDGGIIVLTSGEALDRELVTRVFDVSDLLVVTPDFVGPRWDADTGGGTEGGSSDSPLSGAGDRTVAAADPAAERALREQKLIDAVRLTIGEEYWQPVGRGSIRIFRGKMIVSQTRLGYILLARALSRR